jgi:hypothetical protein
MNIVQSIESAREEKVGSHGIGADVLKTALTRAESALVWIRARHADRALPLLRFLRVDPFDQPAVEEGKVLAKKYLVS